MPNNYTNLLCALTIVISFCIFSRCLTRQPHKAFFSFLIFLNVFLFLLHKGADYFTGVGIDYATITLFKFGFKGAGVGDYTRHIILYSTILALFLIGLCRFVFRKSPNGAYSNNCLLSAYILLAAAFVCNPAIIDIYKLPTGTFISSRASSDFSSAEFYKYYTPAKLERLASGQKNLVFIYAESFESAFFNEDFFPDLVPRLKAIETEAVSFSNIHQTAGTNGTIWAISASQCGLPLFLPNLSILTHGSGQFLPFAVCLGDVLKDDGYHLAYYGGASLGFTGKGNFFKTHGFEEIFGRDELKSRLDDPAYLNFWGLYDDTLLDIGFDRFIELSETGDKFGLFMLTIDAHMPGYASKRCENVRYQDGSNKHLNAIACTDYLLSEFIQKISASPYASQTIIVIASDHVNWNGAPSIDLLKKARQGRKNLFMIIEPGEHHGQSVATKGTAFDIGTTILPFIGYDGEIGLGRNLLDVDEDKTNEIAYIQTRLFNWKTEILKLWGQPRIDRFMAIDLDSKQISIDNKTYDIPVVIEVAEDLSATLLFNLRGPFLANYMNKLKPDQKLLMITPCKDIEVSDNMISETGRAISQTGWCLLAGTGKQVHHLQKIDQPLELKAGELRTMLSIPEK